MNTLCPEATPDIMAGIGAFLKNAWNKEPVIMASCAIGLVGVILPFISPYTKYSGMINEVTPYNYPGMMETCMTFPHIPVKLKEEAWNGLKSYKMNKIPVAPPV